MSDDELIDKMCVTWTTWATPKPFDMRAGMLAVLAVVRAHDSAELAALRADAEIGQRWNRDSSLETWFPYTAEELKRLRAERDTWKGIAGEYSDCLQDLCMTRLYDICRPVSHSWLGQKHVLLIRQAVDFLLERAEKAEAERDALRAAVETAPHSPGCGSQVCTSWACNCWKRAALGEQEAGR